MSVSGTAKLIEAIDERVFAKTGQCLTIHQKAILEQALNGKQLKEIHVEGYSSETIQRGFCPQLWHLLSEITGQRIGIKNLPLVMKSLVEQPLEAIESLSLPVEVDKSPSSNFILSNLIKIRHNLPAPTCSTFVGREAEITQLLKLLSPQHGAQVISVGGIGGVGKTTLAVQVAYQCLRASCNPDQVLQGVPAFDVIVFASAKQHFLTPFGLLQRVSRSQRTLQDIFRQIAHTLENIDIAAKSTEDQIDLLKDALTPLRALLIVDNLETIEDPQEVLSFLYCDLPPTVKAIITTRQQIIFTPIRLSSLTETDAIQLIQHEATEKQVTLNSDETYRLYQRTGGIPVAIHYAIGQMASDYSVDYVLGYLSQASNDVAHFCFETSIAPIRDQPTHHVLMTLTFFPSPVQRAALIDIALSDFPGSTNPYSKGQIAEDAFACLQKLSLVILENGCYDLLPLTREYAIAELKKNPQFEQEARERWVKWYLALAETYGKQDSWNWQSHNDVLESEWSNIQSVIEWCMNEGRYDDLYKLWQQFEIHIHLQGDRGNRPRYWGEHLEWVDWMIQTAEKQDVVVAAELMASRGWLLTAMGQPERLEEADRLYTKAWALSKHYLPKLQLNLSINIAALWVRRRQFKTAQLWLEQAADLVKHDSLENSERSMQLSRIHYYQGVVDFHGEAYKPAKFNFEQAMDYAHHINWQRVVYRSRNWLADIYVKQGDTTTAKDLLEDGLAVAKTSKDIYQLAFYQRSLAHLASTQGNPALAQQWANKALHSFRSLNLAEEEEETHSFLRTLDAEST